MNLYTKESGSGQPMVLLHGNGEDSSYFVNQISFFESKYLVIAVDTRGHGRSPRGCGTFTLERFADDLKGFLDRRGLRRIILLGFSDGGNIALIFALKYPGYVDRLILNGANLNPFGMKPSVLADVAREYVGVVGKLWLQKSGIGRYGGKCRWQQEKCGQKSNFQKKTKNRMDRKD
ncbi:alpha/beta hydrolase [Clostridium sp. AM48-13]|uniref:alpha/beta fold hydrolase n=1 Tax=Clostridium sp. AM48-13 TaxID=2293034 RepID=UPI000E4D24AA|nr:alpha/beta hydrolase [Clostridium sp. AM48-13]